MQACKSGNGPASVPCKLANRETGQHGSHAGLQIRKQACIGPMQACKSGNRPAWVPCKLANRETGQHGSHASLQIGKQACMGPMQACKSGNRLAPSDSRSDSIALDFSAEL